jgi:protein TonB
VLGVVAAHVAALWALQRGLVSHPPETIVPVQLLEAVLAPPRLAEPPRLAPAPPAPPLPVRRAAPPPRPVTRVQRHPAARAQPPAPPPPLATAPIAPPAPDAPSVPITAAPAPAPAPAPARAPVAKIEAPISNADYLQNPQPEWPRQSQRLGEHGVVMLRVLIGVDGRAHQVEIARSSGYPRLDNASRDAVLQWRFVPGKRGGVPEEMWYQVPIRWAE